MKHLKEVNETYLQHMFHALKFSGLFVFAGIVCLIHAIFPFWFEKTSSNAALKISEKIKSRT